VSMTEPHGAILTTCDGCGKVLTLYDPWLGKAKPDIHVTLQDAAGAAIARGWSVGVSEVRCLSCCGKVQMAPLPPRPSESN
jgi:hypothetical protein